MTDNERLFHIIWPDRCWHENPNFKFAACRCLKCGENVTYSANVSPNPTFDHSDEIAQAMMEQGLWEEFWRWLIIQGHMDTFVKTLVTSNSLKSAIIAWREGK